MRTVVGQLVQTPFDTGVNRVHRGGGQVRKQSSSTSPSISRD